MTIAARHQGNPEITEWCPTCRYRTIPLVSGVCGFCDTLIDPESIRQRKLEEARRKQEARARLEQQLLVKNQRLRERRAQTLRGQIIRLIETNGPTTAPDLVSVLRVRDSSVSSALSILAAQGVLTRVGKVPNGRNPRVIYDLKNRVRGMQ